MNTNRVLNSRDLLAMKSYDLSSSAEANRNIAIWLLVCCTAIFGMTVLGGVTRLTGSGLSMVEWAPILGILPPLNEAQWLEVFNLYKQSPEFIHKNFHMGLDDFKGIFWFEYAHRVLGRAIGIIFFVPMIYFIVKGHVSKSLQPKLILMFVLGGCQGLLGWYMVKSGLVNDPHVSQYRLTAHLGMAFIIFAFIFWTALNLLYSKSLAVNDSLAFIRRVAVGITAIVFITVLSGGFVAGMKAGLIYNTFPLMGDSLIPPGLFALEPTWTNFFENMTTVQFDHRVLATIVFISITSFWIMARKYELPRRAKLGINLLLATVVLQVTLGISTLLLEVPVSLGAAHQGGALVLFTVCLFTLHSLKKA